MVAKWASLKGPCWAWKWAGSMGAWRAAMSVELKADEWVAMKVAVTACCLVVSMVVMMVGDLVDLKALR